MNLENRLAVRAAAKERMNSLNYGDEITNVCAGDSNPHWHAYFCGIETKTRKNRYGVERTETFAKCTDNKGKFWNTDIDVIFRGHLDREKCKELYDPIWSAYFK